MPRNGKGSWGDGYLDATYDWAAELGAETGCALQVTMVPAERKGVWVIVVRVLEMVDGKPAGVRVQRRTNWPDASYQSFSAHILREASGLAMMMEQDELLVPPLAP